MLLSPKSTPEAPDPLAQLGSYTYFDRQIQWLFCQTCAVRCFSFTGEGEVVERDVPEVQIPKRDEETRLEIGKEMVGGARRKVWVPKEEGWDESRGESSLNVNAYTLEAKQEGLDLREWVEKKLICYLDCLDEVNGPDFERPHADGAY
jgi:hypothetical protein